ncbi:hypothetical protein B9479_008364, partial [Cryptococcus floricola]
MASNGTNDIVADVIEAFQQDVSEGYLNYPEELMFTECSQRFNDMFREAMNDPSHAENKALYDEQFGRNPSMVISEVETWALISNGKNADDLETEIQCLSELGLSVDLDDQVNGFTHMMQSFITNGEVSVPEALITDYKAIKTDEEFAATAETTRAAVEHAIATSRTWGASRASGGRGDAAS